MIIAFRTVSVFRRLKVALVATIGIFVNGSIAYILSKNRKDLNMRSAFIDMAFDALSSLGAAIAGIVMVVTNVNYVDSIVGLIIAGLLLYNTVNIFKEALQILYEGAPHDVDTKSIGLMTTGQKFVIDYDDMHVWTIRSGYNALSCHITIDQENMDTSRAVVESIKQKLRTYHNIDHSTIEVEFEHSKVHEYHDNH